MMPSPMGSDCQQTMIPCAMAGDCQQPLMPSPMAQLSGQTMGFGMDAQQSLAPWATCSGSPLSSPTGSPMSPQELMANLTGGNGFYLDEAQIAQALLAAAPCEYED